MVPWNILLIGVAAIALAAFALESSSTTAFVLAFATGIRRRKESWGKVKGRNTKNRFKKKEM